ncbi:MAG: hypothetical protein ABEJ03_00700 [Candidatus Nanohaloarchaea archaeon]
MKAAIFNLDDTLVTRQDGERNVLEETRELMDSVGEREGYRTIILTARAESVRDETEKLLERFDLEFDELYMRPESEFSLPDDRFKEKILRKLEKDGYDIRFAVEDKKTVADMFSRNGIECLKIPERHTIRHRLVRKLRKINPVQDLYLDFYRKRFS